MAEQKLRKNTQKKIGVTYDMLSQHYILNRSIVVVVDTEYTSVKHSALANKQV